MAQYDVFQINEQNFFVDVQSDILSDLNSRVVVALRPVEGQKHPEDFQRLKPIIEIKNRHYILIPTDMATIPIRNLPPPITNIAAYDREITDAIDFLFHGF